MLAELLREQIEAEIQQIDDLLGEFAPLLDRCHTGQPDAVERAAVGTVLHSFYTGIEGIFLTVAKRVDGSVPAGDRWHRDLLDQAASATPDRPPLLSGDTKTTLTEYLAFRHFFRQAYAYVLRWEEMQGLVDRLPEVWLQVKGQLRELLEG